MNLRRRAARAHEGDGEESARRLGGGEGRRAKAVEEGDIGAQDKADGVGISVMPFAAMVRSVDDEYDVSMNGAEQ